MLTSAFGIESVLPVVLALRANGGRGDCSASEVLERVGWEESGERVDGGEVMLVVEATALGAEAECGRVGFVAGWGRLRLLFRAGKARLMKVCLVCVGLKVSVALVMVAV